MPHTAKVIWKKKPTEVFSDNKYSRAHKWMFDGGLELPASSSPHVVPLPLSVETAIDPEEAFVASLSSCHMLFFLNLAATQKFTIESYEDHAEGTMSKIENGEMAMTLVTLKPKVIFSGAIIPTAEQITKLHEQAHKKCYIANSVKSEIRVIPRQHD